MIREYYRERTRTRKASEARRIGEILYEYIARSSTFRWTPQRRNGYYSKQKNSSMRLCGGGGKRFRALSGKAAHRQKIIDARTRLRSEKPVIYSPRFHPPLVRARGIRAGLSGEGRESNSGGRVEWASYFWSSSG